MINFFKKKPWLCVGIITILIVLLVVFLMFLVYLGIFVSWLFSKNPVNEAEMAGTYEARILDEDYNALAYDKIVLRTDGTYTEYYTAQKKGSSIEQSGEWSYYSERGAFIFKGDVTFRPKLLSFNKDSLSEFHAPKPGVSVNYGVDVYESEGVVYLEFGEDGRIRYKKL